MISHFSTDLLYSTVLSSKIEREPKILSKYMYHKHKLQYNTKSSPKNLQYFNKCSKLDCLCEAYLLD